MRFSQKMNTKPIRSHSNSLTITFYIYFPVDLTVAHQRNIQIDVKVAGLQVSWNRQNLSALSDLP